VQVILHVLAALPLLIWLYLLLARGRFWQVSKWLPLAVSQSRAPARVVAIIPARDEALVIGDTVKSLLRQELEGTLDVIVVDDASTDGTASAAVEAAHALGTGERLQVLAGMPLPPGWTGKLWAMSQGVVAAQARKPDYLLLTDADVHHGSGNVASLLQIAQSQSCDLVSFMVRLSVATVAEKLLIPAFVFFFFLLYPPAAIASARARTAGAAGGCMLLRPEALSRIGGLQAIRSELIDDCALARAVKASGGSVRLALTDNAHSTRRYGSFGDVGAMISRSAFYQLRHAWWLLLGTLVGLGLSYALPVVLLFSDDVVARLLGAGAWLIMSLCYLSMVRFYRLPLLLSLSLPVVAAFYAAATVHSALCYWTRRGGRWKGRLQDVRV
jgi:hopene-associated glycosyltransferase HpnB